VNTAERVEAGIRIIRSGDENEVRAYLQKTREEDSVAWSILDVTMAVTRSAPHEALRKGVRLLPRVSDRPDVAGFLFHALSVAHTKLGDLSTAENYGLRALEAFERLGNREYAARLKIGLLTSQRFSRAEYESLYRDIRGVASSAGPEHRYDLDYILAVLEVIRGKPEVAIRRLSFLEEPGVGKLHYCRCMEIRGLATRLLGRMGEAVDIYLESAQGYIDFGNAYAAFPCAKALEIIRLKSSEPPPRKLVAKSLTLARKGSWGERAAAHEIEALMAEDEGKVVEGLFEAGKSYYRGYQPMEAFIAGLTSAFLAWRSDHPVFPKVLKFLAPLAPLHPGFRQDPILGRFLISIEQLLRESTEGNHECGLKAHLVGDMRVFVSDQEIFPASWRSQKAARALVYLLLSSKHRMSQDHLFYLLWPKARYTARTREWLYKTMYMIRKNLGNPGLLVKKHDFYQLEGDVWTDLGELENLMLRADATQDTAERNEILSRARELARGELLPEFSYDSYVDEHRQYYERLRKKVFGE